MKLFKLKRCCYLSHMSVNNFWRWKEMRNRKISSSWSIKWFSIVSSSLLFRLQRNSFWTIRICKMKYRPFIYRTRNCTNMRSVKQPSSSQKFGSCRRMERMASTITCTNYILDIRIRKWIETIPTPVWFQGIAGRITWFRFDPWRQSTWCAFRHVLANVTWSSDNWTTGRIFGSRLEFGNIGHVRSNRTRPWHIHPRLRNESHVRWIYRGIRIAQSIAYSLQMVARRM